MTDPRFKVNRIAVSFYTDIDDPLHSRADYAIVPYILVDSCEKYPDYSALSLRFSELYGATMSDNTSVAADNRCTSLAVASIDDRFALEGERIEHDCCELLLDCLLTGNFGMFMDALQHIILPCITISLYPIGLVSRMTRSALLEILGEDYITAGRSYGISEFKMLWAYALKNSLGATATDVALSMGYTLTNTFLTESIFSWPGIGSYISSAVTTLNFPAIMGVTIFGACCYILLNLVADVIVALDPRVRL